MADDAAPDKEAAWYDRLAAGVCECRLCPRRCAIPDGGRGNCGVRANRGGALFALSYGRLTSLAVDPMEKKPLYHFHPGAPILSVGSWGCNLHCLFCQNYPISQAETATSPTTPRELIRQARAANSVGIAYTYNEPVIAWEFLMDCGRAFHDAGLKNVLITNGYCEPGPWNELMELVDAVNIDLKGFDERFYRNVCGGELAPVLDSACTAARRAHLETTTLIIPGQNDHPKTLDELAKWIAGECGEDTPAHLSAYFPRYRMNTEATSRETLVKARDIFRKHLWYVYLGNLPTDEENETQCRSCGAVLVKRRVFTADVVGLNAKGLCAACGTDNNFVV